MSKFVISSKEGLALVLPEIQPITYAYVLEDASIRRLAEHYGVQSTGDVLAILVALQAKGVKAFRELPMASSPSKTVVPIPDGWVGADGQLSRTISSESIEDFLREAITEERYAESMEEVAECFKDIRVSEREIAIISWQAIGIGSDTPLSQFEVEYLEF